MNNNAVALRNEYFSDEQKQLVKDMYFKGCTDDEFTLFIYVSQKTKLDPFLKQIYPVKRWDSKLKKEMMTCQTSIDGYRIIAERTGRYAPGREPTFQYDKEGKLLSATAYVKKMTDDGTWHEIGALAYYKEYVQKTKEGVPNSFWNNMPHGQLSKCAESLALRKAFPNDLSAIRTEDEMQQADCIVVNEKPLNNKISSIQVKELNELLSCLDKEFKKNWFNFIKGDPISANSLEEIPSERFEKLRDQLKNRLPKEQPKEIIENLFDVDEIEMEIAMNGVVNG